ncbi:LOW QUALITY PROTEIN: serine palmitoyltransferase small subunit B [Archocentrus centrarchus]|nr:LOW QUALITY PROTEIN: serine palmitoyltransferase small subunit B [Archocentrus centrarchus]
MAEIELQPSRRLLQCLLCRDFFKFLYINKHRPMHRSSWTLHLQDLRTRMNFKNLREYLAWLYYQYLLITGIYVLEPWEKSIFNSILFSAIAMVVYTSYVFIPIHVRLALEFFSGIFGEQPESTVALMN